MTMTTSPSSLPIAEVFTSIHGEGYWAGTPMTFIRLAGCTVGRTFQNNGPNPVDFPIFPDGKYMFQCTTFDGRTFPCDTDYRKTSELSVEKIISMIPNYVRHVCITGGEPLMHQNNPGFESLIATMNTSLGCITHIETSGTIMPQGSWYDRTWVYVACSPKFKYNPAFLHGFTDEVRIMVDKDLTKLDVDILVSKLPRGFDRIYFAPLTDQHDVMAWDIDSLRAAISFTEQFPGSRISIQMHKVLGVR